ncbi:hypothetical protein BC831DRAFT_452670 [Entophlyctis helioformis]|nr:hypothetical protein BC831DRAFT_452670 [Entophlyctis helioformis]
MGVSWLESKQPQHGRKDDCATVIDDAAVCIAHDHDHDQELQHLQHLQHLPLKSTGNAHGRRRPRKDAGHPSIATVIAAISIVVAAMLSGSSGPLSSSVSPAGPAPAAGPTARPMAAVPDLTPQSHSALLRRGGWPVAAPAASTVPPFAGSGASQSGEIASTPATSMSESETHAQQPTKQQQIDERPLRQHTPGHPHPVNPYEPNDADTILSAAQDIQRKLMVTALQLAAVVVTAMFMW